jgi:hypothetical protein
VAVPLFAGLSLLGRPAPADDAAEPELVPAAS